MRSLRHACPLFSCLVSEAGHFVGFCKRSDGQAAQDLQGKVSDLFLPTENEVTHTEHVDSKDEAHQHKCSAD